MASDEEREKAEHLRDLLGRIIERLCPRYMDTKGEDEADRAINVIGAMQRERDEARADNEKMAAELSKMADKAGAALLEIDGLKALCEEQKNTISDLRGLCLTAWKEYKAGALSGDTLWNMQNEGRLREKGGEEDAGSKMEEQPRT